MNENINKKIVEQNPWLVLKGIINYSIAMTEAAIVDNENERINIGVNILNNSVNQFLEQIRNNENEENKTDEE